MGYYDTPFENLEGKVLQEIAVDADRQHGLRITLRDGEEVFTKYVLTEGDCCSESWWADITGAQSSYGGFIQNVQTNGMDYDRIDDDRTRQDSDVAYGFLIKTDKGVVELIFRNSSNGYYGGWAYDVDYIEDLWEPIKTNDWRA